MPCRICEKSAKTNGSGGVVVGLSEDDDGNAVYTCIKCVNKNLEEKYL